MSEAQTVENTPDSILMPEGSEPIAHKKGGDRLSQIASKYLKQSAPIETPKVETPHVQSDVTNDKPTEPVKAVDIKEEPKESSLKEEPKIESKENSNLLEQKRKIIRRENQLRKSAEDLKRFKEKEAAFRQFEANEGRLKELDEIRSLAKTSPTQAIEKLGLSYDRLTNDLLNKDVRPQSPEALALESLRREHESLKSEIENDRKTLKEEQTKRAIDAFIRETNDVLNKQVDKYELLLKNNQIQEVLNLRAQAFQKTNRMPKVEESAEVVENWFEKTWMPSIYESKKLQAYFKEKGWKSPEEAVAVAVAAKPTESKKSVDSHKPVETKTLSTELSTGSAPTPAQRSKSRDQRLAEIMREHRL